MKITKLGHCALLLEIGGKRLLTDPGIFTLEAQSGLVGLDAIFITHEHPDHLHMDSVKAILRRSPQVKIFTVSAVEKLLKAASVPAEILGHGQSANFAGIAVEAHGEKHAEIYKDIIPVENTGYLFDNRLWYPGDAFTLPPKSSEILALPVAGPWLKISEALDYALTIGPKVAFPVHDGSLKTGGVTHSMPQKFLGEKGIRFESLTEGESLEL
ncbi:MAG: MBL fold metallo-hydrolase [Patescibacteria group bacterium]|nr:MBL fold metallo-hydrolase [Patescibacteria group bacterium]